MNLSEKIPLNVAPLGNPEVIRLLETVLAEAREGKVAGVAVVKTAGPGNTQAGAAGGFMPELFLGCSLIADEIKNLAKGGGQAHRSSILMPGRRM